MTLWTPPPWAAPPPGILVPPPRRRRPVPSWERALIRRRLGFTSPSIAATGSNSQTTDTTTHTIAMPTGISAGDLLVAVVAFDGVPGVSGWPAGWIVFPRINGGSFATNSSQFAYKYAVGGEANFTITTSAAETSVSRCYRISGDAGPTRPPLCRNSSSSGPAAVTPKVEAWEWAQPQDILAIVAVGWENTTPTPTPSGYTNILNTSTGGGSGTGLRVETKAISGFTGSEDPANYTTGSGDRAIWTILIASDPSDPDLTFPIVRNWSEKTTGTGSVVVTLPRQREAGDLVLVGIGLVTNVTISSGIPSGWTTVVNVVGGGAGGERMYALWKVLDGSESDFTLTMSGSSNWAMVSSAILNVDADATVLAATAASGAADSNPNPPSLSANSDLWCAMIQHEGRTVSSYPANYTHRQESPQQTSASLAMAFRQLAATSEDPGTFTDSGSSFWTAATIAIGKANPRHFSAAWIA